MKPTDRRAIRLGAAVITVSLLLRFATPALQGLSTARRMHATQLRQVQRAEDALALLPSLEDSAVAVRESFVELAPLLLEGRTKASALADLSGLVRIMITRVNGHVIGLTPVQDSTRAGGLSRVTLRATLQTDVRGLAIVLQAITASQVLLVLEGVRINATDPFGAADASERLDLELVIAGWFLEA
jgi:hypothetical protein